MIRVLYRWRVNPGQEAVFAKAWSHGTKVIRATVKGARGSLLLQSRTDPCTFVAIARWASAADWRAFRRGEKPDLESFQTAAAVSQLQAVEPLSEVRDLRVLTASETSGQTADSPLHVARAHEKRAERP
jgi:heme-degrading monooxygenase HmoA